MLNSVIHCTLFINWHQFCLLVFLNSSIITIFFPIPLIIAPLFTAPLLTPLCVTPLLLTPLCVTPLEGVLAWTARLALVLGCLRCTLLIVCTLLLLAA